MGSFQTLPFRTHDGRPLPHSFFQGDGAGLLVILPGLHYGPDGPVLYHLAKAMQGSGWDTLGLTYGFQAALAFPWTDHAAEALSELTGVFNEMAGRAYPLLGVAAKSLGAIFLVQLCAQAVVPGIARVAHLTPPLGNPVFDSVLAQTSQPAYIAIGTRDSFFDAPALSKAKQRPATYVRVLEGADHGLDVADDLPATLRTVGQVVQDVEQFFLTGDVPELAPQAGRRP
jgi:hypothetical protein